MNSTWLLGLGLAAIFVSIVLALGTIGVFTTERQAVERTLAALSQTGGLEAGAPNSAPFADRVLDPLFARLTALGRRFTPSGFADKTQQRLDRAGNPEAWSIDRLLAFKAIGLLGLALFGFVIFDKRGFAVGLLVAMLGAAAGYVLPDILLHNLGLKRQHAIEVELADALDLLTIAVEAGLGFDAALAHVARNTEGPLAEELVRLLSEIQIGKSRAEAFQGLLDRTDVAELRAFVSTLVQADAFGIPIADVLRTQSSEMRTRRQQLAEETAQKVPVKIMFPLVLFILPALFVFILGPGVISTLKAFNVI
jgi:tight adherence protein C